MSENTNNFLAPVNHVSDVKVNDGGSNTVTVMHSRGEGGVTKTRTVRIDSNGVAADIVVIKKGRAHLGFPLCDCDVKRPPLKAFPFRSPSLSVGK